MLFKSHWLDVARFDYSIDWRYWVVESWDFENWVFENWGFEGLIPLIIASC